MYRFMLFLWITLSVSSIKPNCYFKPSPSSTKVFQVRYMLARQNVSQSSFCRLGDGKMKGSLVPCRAESYPAGRTPDDAVSRQSLSSCDQTFALEAHVPPLRTTIVDIYSYTQGDSDAFRSTSMPAGFRRHLVGKLFRNVCYSAVTVWFI